MKNLIFLLIYSASLYGMGYVTKACLPDHADRAVFYRHGYEDGIEYARKAIRAYMASRQVNTPEA